MTTTTQARHARPRRGARPRRRWRRVALVAAVTVLVAGYVALTAVFFVTPALGSVRHPQAVVVLGGSGDRVGRGFALATSDHVSTVALSEPKTQACPPSPGRFTVFCFAPVPASTQGEARTVAVLARRYHWDRLLVVAGTAQVTRARVRLERCYHAQLAFSGVDPTTIWGWAYTIAYEQAAMVKAEVWQRSC